MKTPLRIGIIGASASGGWAKGSHVPAVNALEGLELNAVVGSSREKAEAAATAFGAKKAYGDPNELFNDPEIDVVTVAVKVPAHRELVLAALAAGKHVYCEWPLGRNIGEAEEMAEAAGRMGVHTAIGLQARANPAARGARELVAEGAIGKPLTARVVATTSGFGPEFPSGYAYFDDPSTGANLSTIAGGHALDLAAFILGEPKEVNAMTSVQFPTYHLTDTDERHARTVPDHLLVLARFANGCAASFEIVGGEQTPWPFSFEITGSEGRLTLSGGDLHGFQGGDLRLERDGKAEAVAASVAPGLIGPPLNLSEIYAQFVDDIRSGGRTVPDFAHAARLTRLLDTVDRAADTGARQAVSTIK